MLIFSCIYINILAELKFQIIYLEIHSEIIKEMLKMSKKDIRL